MSWTKNIAMVIVAAITGFSPMGVMLVQNHLERQELASGEINRTVLLNHSLFGVSRQSERSGQVHRFQ